MTVATALAVSWKPLANSNPRASSNANPSRMIIPVERSENIGMSAKGIMVVGSAGNRGGINSRTQSGKAPRPSRTAAWRCRKHHERFRRSHCGSLQRVSCYNSVMQSPHFLRSPFQTKACAHEIQHGDAPSTPEGFLSFSGKSHGDPGKGGPLLPADTAPPAGRRSPNPGLQRVVALMKKRETTKTTA